MYSAAVPAALVLGVHPLTLEAIADVARRDRPVAISESAMAAMKRAREVVDRTVAGGDAAPAVYGVNTGFGGASSASSSSSASMASTRVASPPAGFVGGACAGVSGAPSLAPGSSSGGDPKSRLRSPARRRVST